MRNALFAAAAFAALSMIACSEDTTALAVASFAITADTAVVVGGTTQIIPVEKDQNGGVADDMTILYASSDTTIATISTTGLVTGVGPGVATISATVESHTATTTIHVIPAPPPTADTTTTPPADSSATTSRSEKAEAVHVVLRPGNPLFLS